MNQLLNSNTIGGIPVSEIAGEFGTPLYVYDQEIIKQKYKSLREAFTWPRTKLHYAAKASSNLHILATLRELGCGLDTVSVNEMKLGLLAGFKSEDILFTPSSTSINEITEAVNAGVHVVIDSLDLLEAFGQKFGDSVACSVRINPDILAGGHARIQVGHKESKFGIPVFQFQEIVNLVKKYNLNLHGLHCHVGSEIGGNEPFLKVLNLLLEKSAQFPGLRFIDIGSGFKVPYFRNEPEQDIAGLGQLLSERMAEHRESTGKTLALYAEPGKYLVADSGYFLASVVSLKPIHNQTIAGLNTGFNHLLRPMFYDAFHEIINISNPDGPLKEYTLVGNMCETDFFARNREIHEIRRGDVIAFCTAGAYGFSMSSNYNSHTRPAEVMVSNGKTKLIRRAETFDDLIATQKDLFPV